MRTRSLLAILALLAVPAAGMAMGNGKGKGKPAPITCPAPAPGDANVLAAIAAACPCDGTVQPDLSVAPWKNHGKYVSCTVRYRNRLRKAGCFTDDAVRRAVARCAARSTCGKATVLCCTYELGTCNDPTPGDAVAAGTCSNDATVACDIAADCTKSSEHIAHDSAACTADGGVDVGAGSVCDPCPPPPPAS
jgi:hypothetical protein